MFHQLLTPIGDSLGESFCVAVLPIVALVLLLGVLRRPAWQAAITALIVAFIIAVGPWHMPLGPAIQSMLNGATFALWPVMWLVFNGLLLYNISVRSGRFEAFRQWMTSNLPNDRRIMLVVIGFCFGALLEGIAGFGAPVAITSSLLIMMGFPAMEALVFVLIFNTAPVAFGALGIPVTVLGSVTGLPATVVAAMVGRQLPFIALMLPFYVTALYGGWRSDAQPGWPVLLVAGSPTFAAAQFLASNFIDYTLADVLSSLLSLASTLLFVKVWRPAKDPAYQMVVLRGPTRPALTRVAPVARGGCRGCHDRGRDRLVASSALPPKEQRSGVAWPGLPQCRLDHAVSRQALRRDLARHSTTSATGTAILITANLTSAACSGSSSRGLRPLRETNLSAAVAGHRHGGADHRPGLSDELFGTCLYTARQGGRLDALSLHPALAGSWDGSPWPSRSSDTSGDMRCSVWQSASGGRPAAGISNPVLFAATNSSGGVMGKMISPQNIATGAAVTQLKGQEGVIFARTFIHSIIFTLILVALVVLQQFVFPGMIPAVSITGPGGLPARRDQLCAGVTVLLTCSQRRSPRGLRRARRPEFQGCRGRTARRALQRHRCCR